MLFLQSGVYVAYLVLLAIYSTTYPLDKTMIIPPFIISNILALYEMYIIKVGGRLYWSSFWNYIDISRILMIIIYFVLVLNEFAYGMREFLGILTFISWARGVTYFRIFKPTRYLINLIKEVIMDISYFLIVLFYSVISFSLITYVLHGVPNGNTDYFDSLTLAYQANIGDYDSENFGMYYWIFFFSYTVINPIIMLNLIINLMGSTFERVQSDKMIADSLELVEMIIEGETLLM